MFKTKRDLKHYLISSTKLKNQTGKILDLASEENTAVIITKYGQPAYELRKITKKYKMQIKFAQQRKINIFDSYFGQLEQEKKYKAEWDKME